MNRNEKIVIAATAAVVVTSSVVFAIKARMPRENAIALRDKIGAALDAVSHKTIIH